MAIQREENSDILLVDPVPHFESMLSRSSGQAVSFSVMENRISCTFTTRVIRCQPQAICLELPRSIQRIQRRAYIRLAASSNAEIIFRVAGKEEKARVRDYSLGGISFFMANQQKLNLEEELKDPILILPHDKAAVSYQISQAIVGRIDEHFEGKKEDLCP